jgi:hypothetical protein
MDTHQQAHDIFQNEAYTQLPPETGVDNWSLIQAQIIVKQLMSKDFSLPESAGEMCTMLQNYACLVNTAGKVGRDLARELPLPKNAAGDLTPAFLAKMNSYDQFTVELETFAAYVRVWLSGALDVTQLRCIDERIMTILLQD